MPVGIAGLLLAARIVPESHGERSQLDLAGTTLATLGLAAVILPLAEGEQHGWPLWTWLSLAAGPVLLVAFAAQQVRRKRADLAPLVDLALFRSRAFGVGSLAALTYALVPPSFFFVLALYLQDGRGLSALFSGVVFTAVGAGFFAAMLLTQAGHVPAGRRRARGRRDRDAVLRRAARRIVPARFRAEHGRPGGAHRPDRRAGPAAALDESGGLLVLR